MVLVPARRITGRLLALGSKIMEEEEDEDEDEEEQGRQVRPQVRGPGPPDTAHGR